MKSIDTGRRFKEIAKALPKRGTGTQTQALGSSQRAAGLSSQGGDPLLARPDSGKRAGDYHGPTDQLPAEALIAVAAPDLACDGLCLRAAPGGDVAGMDSGLRTT